jgi:hypothetical protein
MGYSRVLSPILSSDLFSTDPKPEKTESTAPAKSH